MGINLYKDDRIYELFKSEKTGKFHLRLKASNDETILQSQGYADKVGAQNEITSITKNT